jgi:hypothetical protein
MHTANLRPAHRLQPTKSDLLTSSSLQSLYYERFNPAQRSASFFTPRKGCLFCDRRTHGRSSYPHTQKGYIVAFAFPWPTYCGAVNYFRYYGFSLVALFVLFYSCVSDRQNNQQQRAVDNLLTDCGFL